MINYITPMSIRKNLLFTLCRTCVETQQQTPCTHSDEEREFIGTWFTDEVKKAVEKGYTINIFLKMKQVSSG